MVVSSSSKRSDVPDGNAAGRPSLGKLRQLGGEIKATRLPPQGQQSAAALVESAEICRPAPH
jgi:hypothetical protein